LCISGLKLRLSFQQFSFAVAVEAAARTMAADSNLFARNHDRTSFGLFFAITRLSKTRQKEHAREHNTDLVRDYRHSDDTFVR
jgi:hypothetical protein